MSGASLRGEWLCRPAVSSQSRTVGNGLDSVPNALGTVATQQIPERETADPSLMYLQYSSRIYIDATEVDGQYCHGDIDLSREIGGTE